MKYIKSIIALAVITAIGVQNICAQADTTQLDEPTRSKFDYYYYAALNAKTQNKYAEAFDYLQHCMLLDSTNASVQVELGAFYNSFGEVEKGLAYVNKALKYDPDNYYYNMIAAGLNKQFGKNKENIEIYNRLLNKYPAKIELYLEMANAYSDDKQYDNALNALDSLQKYSGDNPAIAINKFRLYNMMDKKDEAFAEIQAMIDKSPNNIRFKLLMGDLYMQDNSYDKAQEYYQQAGEIDKEDPNLILSMINFYERTGNKEQSTKEIESAVSNPKMEIEDKMQLVGKYVAILRQNKQDIENANPLFDHLFNQYPNNSEINLLFGEVLLLQEDTDKALEQFEKYKDANPKDPTGYGKILEIVLSDSTFSDTTLNSIQEITEEGMQNIPDAPEYYFYNAMAKLQQDKLEEGKRVLEMGLENANFRNPIIESDFYGQIGDIYHMQKKDDKAFEYYEQAININPHNLHVLNNYSYYLSLERRDLDRAEKMSSITVKAEPTNPTFLDTYAWILFEQESYVLAKIYIEKAIEYGKDEISAEVYEHYGDILALSGNMENAVVQWKKAQEMGGNSKLLKKKIKRKKYYKK